MDIITRSRIPKHNFGSFSSKSTLGRSSTIGELHRLGIEATAHANGESIRLAVEAGVDSIQHGGGLNEDLMNLLVDRNVGFVNTYTIGFQRVFDEWEFLDNEARSIEAWIDRCAKVHQEAIAESERRASRVKQRWSQLKRAKEKGVLVGIGTDSMHGLMALEMENLVKAGFSPLEAITAATGINAQVVGIDADVGTIEKGKYADIISIQGKPDENIRDLRNVNFLMVGGRNYSDLSFR